MNHTNVVAGWANQHDALRSPGERSDSRDSSRRESRMSPRSCGLPDLALPDGQNTQTIGQDVSPKIFHFTEFRNWRMCRGNPAQGRGAYRDRHDTRAGRRWTQVASARMAFRRAGDCERRPRADDRCDVRTAKSCGPDARGLCVKSCGDVCCLTGRAHQPSARRRGQ